MANILGIFGFNPSGGSDVLLAVYGNDIVNVSSGAGYGQNYLSTNRAEFEAFLDKAWVVNNQSVFRFFDGSTWTKTGTQVRAPRATYIKRFKNKLYLGIVTIQGTTYNSRVWYSDLPANDTLTWGFETQTNLQQAVGSNIVNSPGAQFKTYGIKVGDPLVILTGPNAKTYFISSVLSETQLSLTENLLVSDPADTYWVGGNWFDVNTNDNDILTGFGENSDRLLVFKKESLHRYDGNSLRRIKGSPGTTTQRSVVTAGQYTYYFHNTGIYRTDAVTSQLISRPVQEYIDGITSTNFDDIVAWKLDEDVVRFFLGNISNSKTGFTLNRCILDYDIPSQTWSPGQLPFNVLCATSWLESQARNLYLGTDQDEVYQDNTGNADGGTTPIPWNMETNWKFPYTTSVDTEFTRVQIFVRQGRNIKVRYKLYATPNAISKEWLPLGDTKESFTELKIPMDSNRYGRGIKFLLSEYSANEGPIVEKIVFFSRPRTARTIQ